MSNYVTNYQTLSATGGRKNRFDLTHQVITTNDFGIQKPIALKYCVPGDKHSIDVKGFTRLMPMPSPTFGRIDNIIRAYFVPMRTVFPTFLEFVSMNPSPFDASRSSVQSAPYADLGSFRTLFRRVEYSTKIASTEVADFIDRDKTGYKLTLHGKRIFDMLISLGCNINLDEDPHPELQISLAPIFAYYRTYVDWVVPARFLSDHREVYGYIRSLFDINIIHYKLDANDLNLLFKETRCFLEDDFFTSAWELPFSNGTSQSAVTIDLPNPNGDQFFNIVSGKTGNLSSEPDSSGAQVETTSQSQNAHYINYYTLQSLGALQDMLNRGILAGTKVADWLETEFGIKANNKNIDTSLYLGKFDSMIEIGDVMSNADTKSGASGAYLGQFGGKGLGGLQGKFDFSCDEHGYIIITSEILPRTSYYQGLHPEFRMLDRFDFFQPEFDNMAGEAIPLSLLVNSRAVNEYNRGDVHTQLGSPNDVFGFCPRYASLKTSFDTVSGDFRILSRNAGLDSWFLARDFRLSDNSGMEDYKHITENFCDASDGTFTNSYDRIFQYTDNDVDHFFQYFVLMWFAERPMKSVSEFLKPQHEDNGKPITVSPNH